MGPFKASVPIVAQLLKYRSMNTVKPYGFQGSFINKVEF